jgi:hypothetical protein
MSDKLTDQPIVLLISMGAILMMLWIAIGYDPENTSSQGAPLQYSAQVR